MSDDKSEDLAAQDDCGLELDISPEFIEENRKINLVRPRTKFAPFTRAERAKRRNEVYRLHFEHGISGRRIAELMKVDKNTINNDLKILYREIRKEQSEINFSDFYAKQIFRLESQRSRLMGYLEATNEIDKKVTIERQIADIDLRMLSAAEKIEHGSIHFWNEVSSSINQMAEKQKLKYRVTGVFQVLKVSETGYNKIREIMRKEEVNER